VAEKVLGRPTGSMAVPSTGIVWLVYSWSGEGRVASGVGISTREGVGVGPWRIGSGPEGPGGVCSMTGAARCCGMVGR